MKKLNTRQIALNGIVAGLYAAITVVSGPLAFGTAQVRISEALTMLILFEPNLTIGITLGCLISNMVSTVSPVLDTVIGTSATLLACLLTTRIKKPWLAPLPTILVNGIVIGTMLAWIEMPNALLRGIVMFGANVAVGEALAMYVVGIPLYYAMKKTNFIEKLLHPKH